MHPILRLAVPVIATVLLIACDNEQPTPTPTPSPTASVIATAPLPPTASATATTSPTATATQTPTAFPTAPAGPTPPAGYAASCASAFPWAKQVTRPFVCFEEPKAGAVVNRGNVLTVRGYAGGSFENNVVVEVRTVNASGVMASGTMFKMPTTYVAPDAGMPGFWQLTFTLPASGQPSNARVIAYFESPRDGSRVAEASVDIALK